MNNIHKAEKFEKDYTISPPMPNSPRNISPTRT